MLPLQEIVVKGYPICRGIAIGKPFFLNRVNYTIFEVCIPPADTQREIERYRQAILRSKQDIKRLQKQLEIESAEEGILILEAQLEMLQDPLLTTEIETEIQKSNKNVEFIFQQAFLKYQKRFNALNDSFFAERFQDFEDLARRIFGYLHETGHLSLNDLPPSSIVCAQQLTASDVASAHVFSVNAFITETGGATTHAAIVAKTKGIPYITNINLESIKENSQNSVIVDGCTGKVILNPSETTLNEYELLKTDLKLQIKNLEKVIKWPAETYDGYSIRLCANLDMTDEIDLIHEFGAQGIGLFRSEYIFLPKYEIPPEDEQVQFYARIIKELKGLPIVIRTFDLGGDKTVHHSPFSNASHPFLGRNRAMRLLLKEQELFKTQLRAILRASVLGNVSILFPMISTLWELREAKRLLQEVREELNMTQPIPIGCMIEVPSAALTADHFAKECDFLSIGTNDLLQYVLAADRDDHTLSDLYELTEPSIIRLIKLIISESNKVQVPVSVCGEIASDPRFTALLLGLGIQELSVAPRYLPIIKNTIRRTSIVDAIHLAEKALSLVTAQEVFDLIVNDYKQNVPDDFLHIPR